MFDNICIMLTMYEDIVKYSFLEVKQNIIPED